MSKIVHKTGHAVLRAALFGALCAIAVAPLAPALMNRPQAVVPAQKPLQHEVAVTVKLIQVYVTDKAGKPTMGLSKSDFRVFDNGQLVTITEFEAHSAEEAPARQPAAPVPPAAKAEPAPAAPPTQMGRNFFFFFDHDSNDFAGIAKARNAALHFLETAVLPEDEVGVISHGFMSGLVMHCFLTRDRAKVREAVLRVRDVPGRKSYGTGSADTSAAGTIVATSRSDPSGGAIVVSRSGSAGGGSNYTERMSGLAKALRYIPGYKNILYFSQGGRISNRETRDRLEEMSREFAAANAPLYTINTETLDPFNPKGSQGEPTLALVARLSGGKSYQEIGAIQRAPEITADIQRLTRNYYVLGFPVRQSWDGKYHKIKMEISRGEYLVQTQSGYYNPKPFGDYTDIEKELHLFDLALSEKPAGKPPLLFPMRVLTFPSGEGAGILMQAGIPRDVIGFFAGREIEVVSLILDERDNPAGRLRIEPDLRRARDREVVFAWEAILRPGAYRCRIILRDLESGDAALAYAAVTIPDAATTAGGLKLSSPLLLTSYRSVLLWENEAKKGGPRWREVYPFDPNKYTLLAGDLPPGTRSVYALVPCALGKLSRGSVTLRATLVDAATGARVEIPVSVLSAARKDDREAQLVECGFDGVPAAKYLLYVYGEEDSTRAVSYCRTALTVR